MSTLASLATRCLGWLQHAATQVAFRASHSKQAWLRNTLLWCFLKGFPQVNYEEAEEPNPYAYPSFNDFFTRALRRDARTWKANKKHVLSPVDGFVSQIGHLQGNTLLQAKGHEYDVQTLLGGDTALAAPFVDGCFTTLYLAPFNYHRIHIPADGALTDMVYVPGLLHSVSQKTVARVPQLFARNERVVALFDTPLGRMAVVYVGATLVGSIETAWAGIVNRYPARCKSGVTHHSYTDKGPRYRQGDDIGCFHYGSTVILLFEKAAVTWHDALKPEAAVQWGQVIAASRAN